MRRFRYIAVATLTGLAAVVFVVTLARATVFAPTDEMVAPPASAVVAHGDIPTTLSIPALSINAKVQQTGITKSGAMATPTNFTDVAWYKYGPAPGEVGSAVIDGHVDNGLSLAGVFKHLGDITVGDDVYVGMQSGTTLHFVVVDVESYPYKSVPTQLVFSRNDAVRLNLITCEGKWVKGDRTYDQRLIVYTELKNS